MAPTYVSETAETKYRGALGSLMQFQVTFGLLVVYALGIEDAVNWEYITIMCLVVPGKDRCTWYGLINLIKSPDFLQIYAFSPQCGSYAVHA